MRRYSLFKRKNSPFFYVQIRNPETGKYLPPRSTGEKEESEALIVVADWLKNGIPESKKKRCLKEIFTVETILQCIRNISLSEKDVSRIVETLKTEGYLESASIVTSGPENEQLLTFLYRFWDYDNSVYVQEKLRYGHSIGRRHCNDMLNRLPYWKTFFGTDRLKDVTRQRLRDFQGYLKEKCLAPKTSNEITRSGSLPLKWAFQEGILKSNPAAGLRNFSGSARKRGILTPEEVKRLFSIPWADNRARVGNLVACTTGARAGEVLALRLEDVGKEVLFIKHSFSRDDGLKSTKTGEKRTVPLLPAVREELLQLADSNPWGKEGYIFYTEKQEIPMSQNILRRGFWDAVIKISLPEEDRKDKEKIRKVKEVFRARGICFHSWRHYYAVNIANKLDMRIVQFATGHKTQAMAEHYANHAQEEHLKQISEAVQGAFGNVITFEKKKA